MNSTVREVLWFASSALVVVVFVLIVMGAGAERNWPKPEDWVLGVFFLFAMVTSVRLVVWLVRGGGRSFGHWPEMLLVAGGCLLAYGGSAVISERHEVVDRILVTIGAGMSLIGGLLRHGQSRTGQGRGGRNGS